MSPATPTAPGSWRYRALPVFVFVGLMWISEVVDLILPLDLDAFGIRPRELDHLSGIVLAPFLHLGFGHLVANTTTLLVLGSLVALSTGHLWLATAGIIVLGGLGTWLTGASNSVHIGASGVVYGYAAFLTVYGFAARRLGSALVGLVVMALYWSLLWGVLPFHTGVSWQGHLFGALAGAGLAWWLGRRDRQERLGSRHFVG
ncbi:rhomboid family intramembrane serine protease [Mobilicoccus sp.]|uniref:rhomboid family intramembrane serine protease n=2 Tax=Mobilicoccus sp. TaxID=2034349 RepID=UPI0028A18857|nr:rhomboid family intramembrane serine protease [Mobilicoccus sp.]